MWSSTVTGLRRLRMGSPFGGYPLHTAEVVTPFFIVGAGRSGTTLLRRILMANPQVFIPPETYVLGPCIRNFTLSRRLPWAPLVNMTLGHFEYHDQFVHMGISTLRPLALQLYDVPPPQRSLARILDGLYEFLATASGRPSHSRWGDKTPLNTRHLDAIASVFPSALFIHLLRDGYDVTESAMRVEGKRFGDPVAAARHWQQAVRLARDFASRRPNSCVEVRYEDLVSQPAPVLEKLCAKLDLPFFPEMLAVDDEQVSTMGDVVALAHHANTRQPIDSRLAGQGRSRLAPETLQLLQQLIGPDMARVGYDPEISL